MFDTNVFNRILDDAIALESFANHAVAYSTHVQRDEINNTRRTARRIELMKVFHEAIASQEATSSFVVGTSRIGEARLGGDELIPTNTAVWSISRWGQAKWRQSNDVYSAIKAELDKLNKNKPNNIQDALISETALKNEYVLVTDDQDLSAVTRKFGGACLSVAELVQFCENSNTDKWMDGLNKSGHDGED